jgi:hypothetical protein
MKDAPSILMRRTSSGLEALDAIDNESLSLIPIGHDVEVTIKKRRSSPQHRLYWKMLGVVVKATGKWPTAKKMHGELKIALGYTEKKINAFNGAVYYESDSTAFEKMDGVEFKVFMDRAVQLIATDLGFDPLAFYENRMAA